MEDHESPFHRAFMVALVGGVMVSMLFWLAAVACLLLAGEPVSELRFGDSARALARLADDPSDPGGAWRSEAMPGPWLYWPVTALVMLAAVGVAGLLVRWFGGRRWGLERRRRLGVSPEASLATPRDLRPLHVTLPVSGRFILGRIGRQLLATENRAATPTRRWERRSVRRRRLDRGAVALVGPSRMGKSTAAITGVLEWDGPAVLVSVKDDLLAPTLPHRRRMGECAVFDPTGDLAMSYRTRAASGIGAVPGWDEELLVGWSLGRIVRADDAQPAARALCEAAPKGNVEGGDFWMAQAEILLSGLMWVAAASDRSMGDVVAWVLTGDRPDAERGVGTVWPLLDRLRESDDPEVVRDADVVETWLSSVWDQDPKTVGSVYSTANTVVWPWSTRAVAESSRGTSVSLDWLVSGINTLWVSAPPADFERLTPLYGGLVNDLFDQCFRHFARSGPIDPPLLVVLDEAGNMPLTRLPTFISTVAGLGVQLVTLCVPR